MLPWIQRWCFLLGVFFLFASKLGALNILVLGDSLSAAHNIPQEKGWVSLLQARLDAQHLPYTVVNESVSGQTTAEGLAKLDALLASHYPYIFILELGANDGLQGMPVAAIKKRLATMIEKAQSANAQVILLGIGLPESYGAAYSRSILNLYPALAEEYHTRLVPLFLEGVHDQAGMMQADGLHPTAAAQPRLLEHVWEVLEPLL